MIINLTKKNIITILAVVLLIINIIVAIAIFVDIQIIKAPKTEINVNILDVTSEEILIETTQETQNNVKFLKLEFKDNGFGISDDKKMQIFKRNSNQKNGKGMGIGLSLVNEVIKSYNGKIWVENRIENDYSKGSNFVLLIPIY